MNSQLRVKTELDLLAYFSPAGRVPASSDEATVSRLKKWQHNLEGIIPFSHYQIGLRTRETDELYASLCDTKEQAISALRATKRAIRIKSLRTSKRLERLQVQYDTLSGSVGQVFLNLAPDLATRAETAM